MIAVGARLGLLNNLIRLFCCLLGLVAIGWGLFLLPLFWQQASPHAIATRLIRGESFRLESLFDEAQRADKAAQRPFCVPAALHSLFVLRFFILNKAIDDNEQGLTALSYAPLVDAARRTLSCAPAASFVWLTLFWLDAGRHGVNATNIAYLRLSYALGPNEAWIALWRSQLALRLFEALPSDLADGAIREFIGLVNTKALYSRTAEIFKTASPAAQSRIVEQLKAVDIVSRQALARQLRGEDVDVDIPGVNKPERPWQR